MGKEDITTIPYVRKCFYATYANLPTSGIRIGDLGFATDRLVLYRWSGVAWEYLTFHFSSGIAANIPTAADLPNGSCYFETDTKVLKQVQAGAWASISALATVIKLLLFSFQIIAATGTCGDPIRLNDGLTTDSAIFDVVNEYGEVLFITPARITQFRQYGHAANQQNGAAKFQYLNMSDTWTDWVTGVPDVLAAWSGWNSSGGEVQAQGIRMVCTTVPTDGFYRVAEIEVKY